MNRNVLYVCSDVAETVQKTEDMRWAKCRDVWRILRSLLRIIRVFEEPQEIINDIKVGIAKTDGAYVEICDRKEAIKYAIEHGQSGDVIVLAGKGHEDYQEIKGVKYPMDERTLIAEVLEEIREN